jgi:hypothetical protein
VTQGFKEEIAMCEVPAFLELCVSRGVKSVHWGEVKLRGAENLLVGSDARMFGTCKHIYGMCL